jgi:hypothetical protein
MPKMPCLATAASTTKMHHFEWLFACVQELFPHDIVFKLAHSKGNMHKTKNVDMGKQRGTVTKNYFKIICILKWR